APYEPSCTRGEVVSATFLERDQKVEGKLVNGTKYELSYPQQFQEQLTRDILRAPNRVNLRTDPQKSSLFLTALFNILPVVLVLGVIIFFMNQVQGGGNRVMSFGKAKAKLVSKDQPKTTFQDVAGVDEAVEALAAGIVGRALAAAMTNANRP